MTRNSELQKLKFPVGQFQWPQTVNKTDLNKWQQTISVFPERITLEVNCLSDAALHWIYRPGGWSILQVVHHCADSHMNAFIRFKLALTEDEPVIKPYVQSKWGALPDATDAEIKHSLNILESLHARWIVLLKSMKASDFAKEFIHPEMEQAISLDVNLALYAWHCDHHLAHIRQAKKFEGSF